MNFYKINIKDLKYDYEISKSGEIRNNTTNKLLKPFKRSKKDNSYLAIRFKLNDDTLKTYSVHRLMGFVFLGLDLDDKEKIINHKDGKKSNNNLSNLEILSYKENIHHALTESLIKRKLEASDVHKICKLIEEGLSARIICEELFPDNPDDYTNVVQGIRGGRKWTMISKDYNLNTPLRYGNFRKSSLSFKQIKQICKLIPTDQSNVSIAKKMFGSEYAKYEPIVRDIRRKDIHKEISKYYF